MPLYPKKKSISLANGGSVSPLIGLQYTSTKANLPDIQGAEMLVEGMAKNEAYLQSERAKRQIDPETFRELTKGAKGFRADQDRTYARYQSLAEDYNTKAIENPNYVFSPEGKRQLRQIETAIDPTEIAQNSQRYDTTTKEFQDSGVKNEALIRDGKFVFYNENENKTIEVPVSQYAEAVRIPGLVHLRTEGDLYNVLDKTGVSDNGVTFGKGITTKDAMEEVRSFFKDMGSTTTDELKFFGVDPNLDIPVMQQIEQKTKKNSAQRNAAIEALKRGMSSDAVNRFRANYFDRTGDPTVEGFNQNFSDIVSGTSNSMAISEQTSTRDFKNLPDSFLDKFNNALEPAVIEDLNVVSVDDDTWIYFKDAGRAKFFSVGTSAIKPDQRVLDSKSFSGTGYLFADTGPLGNKTSTSEGKPVGLNTDLKNVTHKANEFFPIRKGVIYEKTDRGWVAKEDDKKGHILTLGDESGVKQRGLPITSEDGKYKYLLNEKGQRIVVERKYGRRYVGTDESGNNTTVVEFPNQYETIQETGQANFAMSYEPQTWHTPGEGFNAKALEKLDNVSRSLHNEMLAGKISPSEYNTKARELKTLFEESQGYILDKRLDASPINREVEYLKPTDNIAVPYNAVNKLINIIESVDIADKEMRSNNAAPQRDPNYSKERFNQ